MLVVGQKVGELTVVEVKKLGAACVCSCGNSCFRSHTALRNVNLTRSVPKCVECAKKTRKKQTSRRSLATSKAKAANGGDDVTCLNISEFERKTGGTR